MGNWEGIKELQSLKHLVQAEEFREYMARSYLVEKLWASSGDPRRNRMENPRFFYSSFVQLIVFPLFQNILAF